MGRAHLVVVVRQVFQQGLDDLVDLKGECLVGAHLRLEGLQRVCASPQAPDTTASASRPRSGQRRGEGKAGRKGQDTCQAAEDEVLLDYPV